jgi:hypothetical protein
MEKYAITISDGHNEDWFYYNTKEEYDNAFKVFTDSEDDMHGYILNDDNEYEVIESYYNNII